jgi:hypothetical protein
LSRYNRNLEGYVRCPAEPVSVNFNFRPLVDLSNKKPSIIEAMVKQLLAVLKAFDEIG